MMIRPHRTQPLWMAYLLHRLSGLGLALFLPAHFYLLALALNEPQRLDDYLRFADNPLVKIAEFGLVFLLAVHAFGGLRLLALEFLPWSPRQKTLAASAVAAAFLVAGTFFLQAV
ncbi:succinate dehydrogenase, cytochrome b556 subunit [Hoeflea sp. YIM 152468]|uniref:succinate dehydrogenase, cytochrome b556 subunit n=1 Tax=Hoeflea sp. YIM 152468 TaxID=3031759 RepID=UPI0023D97946|nr:succinate dehydrogenase, cytochrome b556 subunit [Hoeflea sp. YIM 152468]MDF1609823.1 succinate dehydrogenase, cytochrome b556 subunit [Hoeflea sp. YIM 152468]